MVILDPDNSVLLQCMRSATDEWWVTPGGGLDEGESPEDAAFRELIEEVGVREVVLIGPIWHRRLTFPWNDRVIDQSEVFFVAHLAEQVEARGDLDDETLAEQGVFGHRWWTLEELEASDVNRAPGRLVDLVRDYIANGPPPEPIDAGA